MGNQPQVDATPEQQAAARERVRRRLAAARAACTPDYWTRVQSKFGVQPTQG